MEAAESIAAKVSIFSCGLDLGQVQDYTAFVVIEAKGTTLPLVTHELHPQIGKRVPRMMPVEVLPVVGMDIRHIERFPLGTKYTRIAELIEQRFGMVPRPRYLVLDETGVGIGVIEMFGNVPHGITITNGRESVSPAPGKYHIPKRNLIAKLQVMFQNGEIRIARNLPFADVLTRELLAFHVKISASGHDTYEAWREQEHDDLVLAAAMAAWLAEEVFKHAHLAAQEAMRRDAIDYGEFGISPI